MSADFGHASTKFGSKLVRCRPTLAGEAWTDSERIRPMSGKCCPTWPGFGTELRHPLRKSALGLGITTPVSALGSLPLDIALATTRQAFIVHAMYMAHYAARHPGPVRGGGRDAGRRCGTRSVFFLCSSRCVVRLCGTSVCPFPQGWRGACCSRGQKGSLPLGLPSVFLHDGECAFPPTVEGEESTSEETDVDMMGNNICSRRLDLQEHEAEESMCEEKNDDISGNHQASRVA